jgi:hypothetical protein
MGGLIRWRIARRIRAVWVRVVLDLGVFAKATGIGTGT